MIKNTKRFFAIIIAIMFLSNILSSVIVSENTNAAEIGGRVSFYISTKGNDANDGSIEKPFATLERARDAVRELKRNGGYPENGVTVYLRGGIYSRSSTFSLNEKDSGTIKAPVVYRAYGTEKVKLVGGASLAMSEFSVVTDKEILGRLPSEAQGKVLQVDLKSKGITEYGEMPLYGHSTFFLNKLTNYKSSSPSPELFFNGKVMTLSRWPNSDFAKIGDIIEQGSIVRRWMDDLKGSTGDTSINSYVPPEKRDNPPKGFTFKVNTDRLARWTKADDIWMFGYWYWDWSDQSVKVASIDAAKSEVKSVHPSPYGLKKDQRFYFYNLLEEIDMPSEWYLDRTSGMLYFYPPSNDKKAIVQISLLDKDMVKMENVSNVTIKNIELEASRENAITIKGGENNLVTGCEMSKLGSNAISISGGKNHGITNCKIYDTGAGGISLEGGDRVTLTPAGHYAENNEIYNFSRIVKTYSGAVALGGVGNRASYNKIYEGPHLAIVIRGNDHIIEYNEIFDVCKEADDMGAIYAGRDLTQRGNIIRNNYIHNIYSDSSNHVGVHAIYLDDSWSSADITGNMFVKVQGAGILINGGRDFNVKNNVFVDMKYAVSISDVGLAERLTKSHWEVHGYGTKKDPYDGPTVPYNKEPYTKYPNLANVMEDQPQYPKYNVVTNNLVYKSTDFYFWTFATQATEEEIRSINTIKDNLVVDNDKMFVNPQANDFRLKEDAEVYNKLPEFKKIPYERVGVYNNRIKEKLDSALVLLIGNPIGLVNNNKKPIDSSNKEVMPLIKGGRTLVPVRFIAESLGAEVGWNGETSEITIKQGEKAIKMVLGSKMISINGAENELDVPAQSINGRTLIPLRALVESLGKKVFWDSRGLIAISDVDNIFDAKEEKGLIGEVINQISVN